MKNRFKYKNIYYIINKGEAVIIGFTQKVTDIVIPEKIHGYTVTKIEIDFNYIVLGYASICIPKTVRHIKGFVFDDSNSRVSWTPTITIDPRNQWYEIKNGALFEIKTGSFILYLYYDENEQYHIPSETKIIAPYAFFCSMLNNIIIPEGVEKIKHNALTTWIFGLNSINIPSSVKEIEPLAFGTWVEHDGFGAININPNSIFELKDSCIINKKEKRLHAFVRLKYYEYPVHFWVPNDIQIIGEKAFKDCDGICLYVPRKSYALDYAKNNKIPYKICEDF